MTKAALTYLLKKIYVSRSFLLNSAPFIGGSSKLAFLFSLHLSLFRLIDSQRSQVLQHESIIQRGWIGGISLLPTCWIRLGGH